MTINSENLLNSILDSLSRIEIIDPAILPNIDLYMDQVTTFMEQQLASTKRYEEDKVLTKTMINNYTKNELLPPPDKKKYNKEHMILLTMIYYFKNIISINDIQKITKPISEKYFGKSDSISLETLYDELRTHTNDQVPYISEDILRKYEVSRTAFSHLEGEEQSQLQDLSFLCLLIMDVYTKKLLIEKMVDLIHVEPETPSKKEKAPKEKADKKKKEAE